MENYFHQKIYKYLLCFTEKPRKVFLQGRKTEHGMIPLKAMNSLQCYNRYYGSTFLHHPYQLMENQRASASEDTVKNHLTEKMKETIRKQQNSPSIREAIKHSPPPPSSMSTSPKPLEKQILNYPQMHHQRTQELYNNLQKIQELQTIHQKTQEMYKDLQTPPPEKTPQIPNHPSHFQTIHQKTQEMYKNHKTPPPQDNQHQLTYPNQQDHYRKTTPPLKESDISNHTQTIHQRTLEMYKNLQTPPPQDKQHQNPLNRQIQQELGRKIPNKTTTSPKGVANHMQIIHQKTQELYKNLRTPPPQDNQHLNPPILEHYRKQEFDRKIQSKRTPPPPKETSFNSSPIPAIHLKTPEVYKNPLIPEDSKKPNPRYVRHNSVRDIHQELYKNHQTNPYPPPCTKPVHQRTQDIYSNHQTLPPPPQTKKISTPPLNSQMIQQKTHDIYKNLQTPPPPQETKSLNHPTYNRIRKFALEKQQEHQETNNPEANTTNSQKTGKNNTVKSF